MKWTKATITTSSIDIENITAILLELGITGLEIHDPSEMNAFLSGSSQEWDYVDDTLLASCPNSSTGADASVVFYLGTDTGSKALISTIEKALNATSSLSRQACLTTEQADDQDWLHEWKKHFHPFKIGNIIIAPEWETVNNSCNDIIFKIDPGLAFGTGQHATTMLCIEALQEHIQEGCNILDIGCGSGILSIISLLLGATHATACDIDPAAVEITKRNASLNAISPSTLDAHTGDILSSPALQDTITCKKYNVILANIVADVIIRLAPLIHSILAPGGTFIASGIICERLDDVLHALAANNLKVSETKTSEGWCLVVANG